MIATRQIPQSFSRDLYVRICEDQLHNLELHHIYSEVLTRAHANPASGYTEWVSDVGNDRVSMAWDWEILSDGALRVAPGNVMRTNIMLVDRAGYDVGLVQTDSICMRKLETTAWRLTLQELLSTKQLV